MTTVNLSLVITPEALSALFSLFPNLNGKLDKIMATQAQTAIDVVALTAQVDALFPVVEKIGAEIDASLTEIQALKDLLADSGNTDPAVTAALQALATRWGSFATNLAALDLKVPDAAA